MNDYKVKSKTKPITSRKPTHHGLFRKAQLLTALAACIFASSPVFADLVFSAPPRETAEKGMEYYAPLVEQLSVLLGEKVVYEHPANWAEYSQKMRDDYYDIVFDGPHFTAWRIKNLDHQPVATLPGKLGFLLATHKNADSINGTRDLVGKQICGMASPHLATDMIYDLFSNPVLQPLIYDIKGRMKDVYAAFKAGKCQATIFRDSAYKHLPETEKKKLKIIAKTRVLPNQSITVSKRLKPKARMIGDFFLSKKGASSSDGILSRYSKKNKSFKTVSARQFRGAEDILEGVVWGW
jgi:ABC-type phosphate/phosphonate transport system substrate-binding protein